MANAGAEEEYDPFAHREVKKPTNNWETLAHLLKGCLGSGILAMPIAMKHAGLWMGFILTLITGFILLYCIRLVVKNSQRLCVRMKVPVMAFDEVGENALLMGPEPYKKFAKAMRYSINGFLIVDLYGCCIVYIVFSAKNLKQVIDFYTDYHLTVREYILILLPFLLVFILIRTLKVLAIVSMVADILIVFGLSVIMYKIFSNFDDMGETYAIGQKWVSYPLYLGIAIFALEGIGVVMPLENNMKTPKDFIQGWNILSIGMVIVIVLYTILGFFGYLKYGEDIEGSITLNLPQDEILCQVVKLCFAVSMFATYFLQFYVPFNIIWRNYRESFGKWNLLVEYGVRYIIVIITDMIAFAIPTIGSIMAFAGALCLSFLGIIFPAVIDHVTCYESPGMGKFKWRLIVNISLFIFGLLAFAFGTLAAVYDILDEFVLG